MWVRPEKLRLLGTSPPLSTNYLVANDVYRLVTKGTIEEQILALANTKLALDQSISEDDNAIEGKAQEIVAMMLLKAEEERGKKVEEGGGKADDGKEDGDKE